MFIMKYGSKYRQWHSKFFVYFSSHKEIVVLKFFLLTLLVFLFLGCLSRGQWKNLTKRWSHLRNTGVRERRQYGNEDFSVLYSNLVTSSRVCMSCSGKDDMQTAIVKKWARLN